MTNAKVIKYLKHLYYYNLFFLWIMFSEFWYNII